ncbi:MAG: FlgO family outer membrane protein [Nitrospirota bacterium]
MKHARFALLLSALTAILLLVLGMWSPAHAQFKKTKIAVLDFQMQGEQTSAKDMGKIVAEWLITGLVETGRFDVIERRLLEKLLEEQKLGVTGAIDPNSAAQLGKILGVRIIVSGTVTSLEGYTEINARLINVDSASIIAAEKVRAGSAEKLRDLVNKITDKIVLAFPMEGYIVQRVDKKVTIDLGKQIGVRPGMKFIVFKEGKIIKHPKTGEVLDVETIETGLIEIRDVKDKTAIGMIVQESTPNAVAYGSMVRSSTKDSLDMDSTENKSVQQDSGERRGLIPMPSFMRRKTD